MSIRRLVLRQVIESSRISVCLWYPYGLASMAAPVCAWPSSFWPAPPSPHRFPQPSPLLTAQGSTLIVAKGISNCRWTLLIVAGQPAASRCRDKWTDHFGPQPKSRRAPHSSPKGLSFCVIRRFRLRFLTKDATLPKRPVPLCDSSFSSWVFAEAKRSVLLSKYPPHSAGDAINGQTISAPSSLRSRRSVLLRSSGPQPACPSEGLSSCRCA
jgi:hypothetical protein